MSDLTSERLTELRRIAEAATPGPLTVHPCDDARYAAFVDAPHLGPDAPELAVFLIERDARFFAEFDRDTALALLDRVEELSLACAAALRVLVAAGLFEQDEDGNITADTRFYDDLCKLANAARYVVDYATDGLVAESEAYLRHQFDVAHAEAERWQDELIAARKVVEAARPIVNAEHDVDPVDVYYLREAIRSYDERIGGAE